MRIESTTRRATDSDVTTWTSTPSVQNIKIALRSSDPRLGECGGGDAAGAGGRRGRRGRHRSTAGQTEGEWAHCYICTCFHLLHLYL